MRTIAAQSASGVRIGAARSAGEWIVPGVRWLFALASRWWQAWQQVAGRLSDDPASFVNQR